MLAAKLGFAYIDTGAMYRAVTLAAIKKNIPLGSADQIAELACSLLLEFKKDDKNINYIFCDGENVSEEIRSQEVTKKVSEVSAHRALRQVMVMKQQKLAEENDVIMDGRDIGTVVLPQAECKIFLTAAHKERAQRRFKELMSKGYQGEFDDVFIEMGIRDQQDIYREDGPLIPAEDAVIIDTTGLKTEEVVLHICRICRC